MSNTSVLIVEDERIVAEDIKRNLEKLGYEICGTSVSGEEALEIVDEKRPNIVLMDIVLKGQMNGIETAGKIHEKYEIPVVYLTAYADKETLDKAKITEPYGYILKPYQERELQSAVEIALFKHAQERVLKESEKLHRTLIEKLLQGIVILQGDSPRIVFSNSALSDLTGYSVDELTGFKPDEVLALIHPDEREKFLQGLQECVTGNEKTLHTEFQLIHKDGEPRWVEMFVTGIKYKGESAVQAVFMDIAERKMVERALMEKEFKIDLFDRSVDGDYIKLLWKAILLTQTT